MRTTTRPSVAAGPGPRGQTKTRDYRGTTGKGVKIRLKTKDGKGLGITAQKKDIRVSATPKQATVKVGPASVTRKINKEDMTFKDFVNQIQERELTPTELERKEDIVKSMKKKMPEFEKNYGKDAKSVMYATATKMAKNES